MTYDVQQEIQQLEKRMLEEGIKNKKIDKLEKNVKEVSEKLFKEYNIDTENLKESKNRIYLQYLKRFFHHCEILEEPASKKINKALEDFEDKELAKSAVVVSFGSIDPDLMNKDLIKLSNSILEENYSKRKY